MTIPDSPALDLDALTALEQAATGAPWRLDREYAYDEYAVYSPNGAVGLAWSLDDAELIAAARNALPALLSALTAARAERDELTEQARIDLAEVMAQRDEALSDGTRLLIELAEAREQAKQAQAELAELRRTLRAVRTVCEADYSTQCATDVLRLIPPRLVAEATSTAAPNADEPEPCGAFGPDLPFITCTYPAGHAPIPIDVRGVGVREMDHGNDKQYRTWWNGRTALVHGDALASQRDREISAENAAIVLGPREADAVPATAGADEQTTTTCGLVPPSDVEGIGGCVRPTGHNGDHLGPEVDDIAWKWTNPAPVSAVPATDDTGHADGAA